MLMHLSIFCLPEGEGAEGIHGALERRPFLTGGNLKKLIEGLDAPRRKWLSLGWGFRLQTF